MTKHDQNSTCNNDIYNQHKIINLNQQQIPDVKYKKQQRDKRNHGDDFVAPDGGWGWLVAIASGVNILVTFSIVQNFGIIYRERMLNLGITSTELTTIINIQISMSMLSGLINGALFKLFTFRQIALMGSLLMSLGVFLSIFAYSFIFYVCTISIIYGLGRGCIMSSSGLAVNTYFKQRRRTAMAYLFGVAGVGPIFLPYLATYLMQSFGMVGTVLIFSGISLHTFAGSLIFQPVKWHVKKSKDVLRKEAQQQALIAQNEPKIESTAEKEAFDCVELVHQHTTELLQNELSKEPPQDEVKKHPYYKKIINFFDLDLLQDITYINLAIALTLATFVESNFSMLIPFVLNDFGFAKNQIATAMSILGLSDLTTRFLIPVITTKMSFSNKTYLICSILGMILGRIVLTVTRNFYIMLAVFFWMGINKAVRVVFWALILPGYVSLKRLPAATGLQQMLSSLFAMAVGPLIGVIRDKTNNVFMVNFLNCLYLLPIFTCILEALWRRHQRKTKISSAEKN